MPFLLLGMLVPEILVSSSLLTPGLSSSVSISGRQSSLLTPARASPAAPFTILQVAVASALRDLPRSPGIHDHFCA